MTALTSLMRDVNAFAKSEPLDVQRKIRSTVEFLDESLSLYRLEPGGAERTLFIEVAPGA